MHKLTSTSAASTPVALSHPGPRQAALEYFHGEVGPYWPCEIDGVQGILTVQIEDKGVEFLPDAIADADLAKMHRCAPLLPPPGDEVTRRLIRALRLERQNGDTRLGRELVAILSNHCGERGDNEGAVETLQRIIRERDAARGQLG